MVNLLQQQTPHVLLPFYLCVCVCWGHFPKSSFFKVFIQLNPEGMLVPRNRAHWKWVLKGWEGVLHIQECVHPSLPSFLHKFFDDWWITTSWQVVESPLPPSTCVCVAHRPFNRAHICPQPSPPTWCPNPSRCAAVRARGTVLECKQRSDFKRLHGQGDGTETGARKTH